jgi:hypothetical protein
LIVGVVVIVIIGLLYARLVVPRGTAAFPFRVVSSLSGVILAVFIRRGWVGALISVAVGIVVGTVLLGTMGRFLFVIGNLITFAFYAGYGIIGWAVTRLIGWVMSSLSRKNR